MKKKGYKQLKKSSSTSFWVLQAPKNWLKYTTDRLYSKFEPLNHYNKEQNSKI